MNSTVLRDLFQHLDHAGAFDQDKWNFHIYKESVIDEWHIGSQFKQMVVYGTGETLEEALLQALVFVLKSPDYYKERKYRRKS